MLTVHPQYIKDTNGNPSLVVLPAQEFESMMEELDDIRLYDEAKKEDTGERMLFSDYLNSRSMPSYTIVINPKAQKQLDKFSDYITAPILEAIAGLADDLCPNGYKKLKGRDGYRIRTGQYRIDHRRCCGRPSERHL